MAPIPTPTVPPTLSPSPRPESRATREYELGLHFEEGGLLTLALEAYSKAIELDPSLGDAYYHRAQVLVTTGDTARAVADLEQVLALTQDEALKEAARQLLSLVQ